ncbi:hypothetical protein B0T20DRAFT_475229 [Sordaria brevicollis]|uniref:Uncharacterized protein n=1 Tax=Sordaria brevicollis TaxID=83679 RepID=A0AAE0PPD3_SORBR|nr:hypothetical protein B0T20DRAFT_475229 [Sordaria brevicollis]
MSYKHRRLMRRRLERYHDLLTKQLRPMIEDAAAAIAESTTATTTDNPESDDTDQNIEDDSDTTSDDTDEDSDEDLCEWEHTKDKSSKESCARLTKWRCGVKRKVIWEDDTPGHCKNPDKGSVRRELGQHDDDTASSSTEASNIEHVGVDKDADTSGTSSRGFSVPIWDGPASNTNNVSGEPEEADDGDDTSDGSETSITVMLNQTTPDSESSTDEASEDLTTPPSSPCRETFITESPIIMNYPSHQASILGKCTVIDYSQFGPADFSFSRQFIQFECGTPLDIFPFHCLPTPSPGTTYYCSTPSIFSCSSVYSIYSTSSISSQPCFTVSPAELKFFNKHVEEVGFMIQCIDYQFKMQEYRQEIRKQDRFRKREAEIEEQMKMFQWSHGVTSQWDRQEGVGEADTYEDSAEETGHQGSGTSGELTSSGLDDEQSAATSCEDVEIPDTSELVELRMDCGSHKDKGDLDSVWPEDIGEDDNVEEDWNWSAKLTELKEKVHPHQPVRPSPLRMGYTPDDMIWEEMVEEAEYLSFYGHQSKKDKLGRRYWRL